MDDVILRRKGLSQLQREINRKLFKLLVKTELLEAIICELE